MISTDRPSFIGLLLLLVVLSAAGVIVSSYQSRQLFSTLQNEWRGSIQLEEQWGRLLLEESTWAAHVRIEHEARLRLQMAMPEPTEIIIVEK